MAYIQLLLCVNCFVKGLERLDPSGKNQDLRTVQSLTLSELEVIEHVDLCSLSQLPASSSPCTEEQLQSISTLLEHLITPMLTQHHTVIINLSTLLE